MVINQSNQTPQPGRYIPGRKEIKMSATKYNDRSVIFEIKEHIGTMRDRGDGWAFEVNVVSWNEEAPKIDLRTWNKDHTRMTRGVTLTEEEAWELASLIIYRKGYQIVDDDLNII